MIPIQPPDPDLQTKLDAAQDVIEVLKHHEVDAVVGVDRLAFLLLNEVRESLVISEAGFRALFDLGGIGVFQADASDFRFTEVNAKFCALVGYTAKELLTLTPVGLTHPKDQPRVLRLMTPILRGSPDTWSIDKRFIRKDRTVIWVAVHGAAIRDEQGVVIRLLAMVSDITQCKEAELAHRRALAAKSKARRSRKSPLLRSPASRAETLQPPLHPGAAVALMKTSSEIQAAVCRALNLFEKEFIGGNPKSVHAHILGDLLVVRLKGVLTVAEAQLLKAVPSNRNRNLVKEVRAQLMATALPVLRPLIEGITGATLINFFHDISTITGEEFVIFTLAPPPPGGPRPPKTKPPADRGSISKTPHPRGQRPPNVNRVPRPAQP